MGKYSLKYCLILLFENIQRSNNYDLMIYPFCSTRWSIFHWPRAKTFCPWQKSSSAYRTNVLLLLMWVGNFGAILADSGFYRKDSIKLHLEHRIEIGRRATLVGAFVVCTTSVKHRRTTAGSNPRFQSRPKLLVTGYRHINSRTLAQKK